MAQLFAESLVLAEVGQRERWYEVVGVVGDFPPNEMEPGAPAARMYHALEPG